MVGSDVLHVNHAVPKGSEDYLLESQDLYQLQFQRLVKTPEGNKYARASVNVGHKQFLEIVEKYGFKLADRWQVWDKTNKKNVPYTEGLGS